MSNVETNKDMMRALKLKGALAEYEAELESSQYRMLPFDERLGYLLAAENNHKRDNRTRIRHNKARFAQPGACVEDIIYDADRELDKALILRLASCDFVSRRENVLVLGASDSGKTYLGCALGGICVQARHTGLIHKAG